MDNKRQQRGSNPYPRFYLLVKSVYKMEKSGQPWSWTECTKGMRRSQITKKDLLPIVKAFKKMPTEDECREIYDRCINMQDVRTKRRHGMRIDETQTVMEFGTDRGSLLLQISHKLSQHNDPAIREISDMVAQLASV